MFMGRLGIWGGNQLAPSSSPTTQCANGSELYGNDPTLQDQRRIDSGYYEPEDEGETVRQFLLDAPRMDIMIDGRRWMRADEPSVLLEQLFSVFPRRSAILAAQFCTQTALAPFFCSVKETLGQETHFVDGGRQLVRLDSSKMEMEVEKPFKVVDFDDHMNARVLFVVTLSLYVNLDDGHVYHRFSRTNLVEQDWVYVEDDTEEDNAEFEDGGGAEDIAASALRMRNAS